MINPVPEAFRDRVQELVDKFHAHRETYLAPTYNESQVRLDFIDPLFEALGWDVRNVAGLNAFDREVLVESGIVIGPGRPDYGFRIERQIRFFVEAKAPHVALQRTEVILQAKRYAWNTRTVAFAVVTDFEEFRLYEATTRPDPKHPEVGLIFAHRYTDYMTPAALADLWTLARDSVRAGSLDELLKRAARDKRRRVPVDEAFLADLTGWRAEMAKALFKAQADLQAADLNGAVQAWLDRLVFVRVAEDRGVLPDRQLEAHVAAWHDSGGARSLAASLLTLFRDIHDRLNGELFRPHPSDTFNWDDALLARVINLLYPPLSPYLFNVIGVELLGSIYERYLGKTIRLTAKRAVVEEKPEVRKAGGVYYTPVYIVDYIVAQTLGPLVEGQTPAQIAQLKILDPACGSGSFLLGAYQYLLDYHTRYYAEQAENKRALRESQQAYLVVADHDQPRLALAQKRAILLNNLHGVDLDPQAVEITMLSLYLKLLEGERGLITGDSVMPLLSGNIKCGNSLISPDFAEQLPLGSDGNGLRVRVFDWENVREGFGRVLKEGGFDIVIGNPPYLKIEHIPEVDRAYFARTYRSFMKRYDAYGLFIERALALLKPDGHLGMIVPSTFLNNLSFRALRKILLDTTRIKQLVNLGGRVFEGVTNDTLILLTTKDQAAPAHTTLIDVPYYGAGLEAAQSLGVKDFTQAAKPPDYVLEIRVSLAVDDILAKMNRSGLTLGDLCEGFQGFVTGGNEAYIVAESVVRKERLERKLCKPAVFGDNISRYGPPVSESSVIYLTKNSDLKKYPHVKTRLEPFRSQLQKKREVRLKRQPWYALQWPRVQANFERSPKILVQAIRNLSLKRRVVATLDREGLYADHTLNVLYTEQTEYDLRYMLGLLNSRLVNFIFSKKYVDINIKGIYLAAVPVPRIDFTDTADKAQHDQLVVLVERIMTLYQRRAITTSAMGLEQLEREIKFADDKIDALVYDLYGLTEAEIKIVEGG